MKIAIIHPFLLGTDYFLPKCRETGIAGAEETLLNFTDYLTESGIEITIFTRTGTGIFKDRDVIWKDIAMLNHQDYYDITWSWSDSYEVISNYFKEWRFRFRFFRFVNQQSDKKMTSCLSFLITA